MNAPKWTCVALWLYAAAALVIAGIIGVGIVWFR